MAFGNNRAGVQRRASFRQAGGATIIFKHPYLAGQLSSTESVIDEVDISACCKLEGRFFEATPNQDSAKQVVLVDGSTVTITNRMLNGTITMPVVKTTGLVATGDFIACCQLIKSIGDSVGGLLYKTEYIDGKALTRIYYGVTVKNVPDDVSEGNDVAVYNVQLFYAGWLDAVSEPSVSALKIWAVGSSNGVEGNYKPYVVQNGGTQDKTVSTAGLGITGEGLTDDTSVDTLSKASTFEEKKSYGDTSTNTDKNSSIVSVISKIAPAPASDSDSDSSGT